MNLGRYIIAEIKDLSKNRMMFISVLVALLVPLVYSAIILSAKWWPTDNLDNLPVAIVNNDEGAINDGEKINVGEQLVESLQEDDQLGWDFVSEEEAQRGMDNQKYFMTVKVPKDFSKKTITVMDDNPVKPELEYIQNEGMHYQGTTVTNQAIESLQNQLATQITETYVETVFDQLGDVADGFAEAHDGAEQIEDGAGQLKDGSNEILGALVEKAPDISRLADGSQELNAGTNELLSNLKGKSSDISKLADGAKQVNDGTGLLLSTLNEKSSDISRLNDGAGQLSKGAKELAAGTKELAAGTDQLAEGADELSAGSKQLAAGANELKEGSVALSAGAKDAAEGSKALKAGLDGQLVPGSQELAAGVAQAQQGVLETIASMETLYEALKVLEANHPELKNDFIFNVAKNSLYDGLYGEEGAEYKKESFQKLVNGANQLRDGIAKGSEFNEGLTALTAGLGELAAGTKELQTGASQLSAGAGELNKGVSQLKTGAGELRAGAKELRAGAGELSAGANQVADGTSTVRGGWTDLQDNVALLHDGTTQVADGNQTVEAGWQQLTTGATQLHDGSTQIADGTSTVRTGWGDLTDGVSQVDDGLDQLLGGSTELADGLYGGVERTSSLNPTDENKTMFANPVLLKGESINSFQYYRDANAPYILTLALFVGVLALSFVVSYRRPAVLPANAVTWFSGKLVNLILLVTAQALIVSLYTLFILKMQVHSGVGLVLFSVWVSLTFLMIILFLVALAGNIGRFIALAFAVLQLSTTGSALPVHMLPEGLRNLSVFLPFTHSINGFKNIITLGNSSVIWASTSALFIYFILFAALSLAVFLWKYRSLRSERVEVTEEAA